MGLRKKLYHIVENRQGKRWWPNLVFTNILFTAILLNAVTYVLSTIPGSQRQHQGLWTSFARFSLVFFILEYMLRLWVCVEDNQYKHKIWGRLKFVLSPTAIIDLLTILSFVLASLSPKLAVIRILQLFRLLRIPRYARSLRLIVQVLGHKKDELVLSTTLVLFMLLLLSSIMYYIENRFQPHQFSSIPATMWWGINAMTTVGYGDIYPITSVGKFIGGLTAMLGVGLFALPTGIIVSGFIEHVRGQKEPVRQRCPHCHQEIYP
ncbi:ion transporter [Spirosoma sp. SC4-14]|uniref:ion transporter n=1 Tax=Spirosoma sp. SC4-14 TaxID=3128900 RepID=UPI0030D07E59